MLETPKFHHLHLNSVDPDVAIDFYVRHFPTTSRAAWGGFPALSSPNDVLILFTRVASPPPIEPDTPIWHFGWHVPDSRAALQMYSSRPDLQLLPLYTGDEDRSVLISSDAWPGAGGSLGRTRSQIDEAKATGVQPTRSGGFAYMQGPDCALVEYAGNHPSERFNHVHMWQEDPLCAQLWYQRHLDAALLPGRTGGTVLHEGNCKVVRGPEPSYPALTPDGTYRNPSGGVAFGDVWLPWYMRQGEEPLVPTRGHLYDHFALSVIDLDGWVARLNSGGVTFLQETYPLGDTRAVMISGPSQEAIELVEVT